METIFWRVKITDTPLATRHCATCGTKTPHVSSDLFRVNAHRKKLDVWLVYRCQICQTTWNCTIASRTNPKNFEAETLSRYLSNDADLARRCALDASLLRKNGAEIGEPAFEVVGRSLDAGESARIAISCNPASSIRLSSVLRVKLGLSRKAFDKLADSCVIELEGPGDLRKARMTGSHTVVARGLTGTQEKTV